MTTGMVGVYPGPMTTTENPATVLITFTDLGGQTYIERVSLSLAYHAVTHDIAKPATDEGRAALQQYDPRDEQDDIHPNETGWTGR